MYPESETRCDVPARRAPHAPRLLRPRLAGVTSTLLAGAALLAGCSESSDDVMAPVVITPVLVATVGVAGGTLELPGELALEFAAGALTGDTEITISEVSAGPSGRVGKVFELEPDGLTFDAAVTLRLRIPVDEMPDGSLPEEIRLSTNQGAGWEDSPGATVSSVRASAADDAQWELEAPLAHFSSYTMVLLSETQVLYGTFGLDPTEAYGFGKNGVVASFDGAAVTAVPSGLSATLIDGWGVSSQDLLVVGQFGGEGRIWRGSTGSLAPEPVGGRTTTGVFLRGIDGDDALVIAVGGGGCLFENDGSGFFEPFDPVVSTNTRDLLGVKCFGGGEAIAVGTDVVLARTGGAWQTMDTSSITANRLFLRAVWGSSSTDVYMAGFERTSAGIEGRVYHYTGAWPPSDVGSLPGAPGRLHGVWGDADDLYVVGERNVLYHRDATGAWLDETPCSETTTTFYDVWATDVDAVTVVGIASAPAGNEAAFIFPGSGCDTIDAGGGGGGDGSSDDGSLFFTGRLDASGAGLFGRVEIDVTAYESIGAFAYRNGKLEATGGASSGSQTIVLDTTFDQLTLRSCGGWVKEIRFSNTSGVEVAVVDFPADPGALCGTPFAESGITIVPGDDPSCSICDVFWSED